jgi:hypothetical protein
VKNSDFDRVSVACTGLAPEPAISSVADAPARHLCLAKLLLRALLPGSTDPKIRATRRSTPELRFSDCEGWRLDFGFDVLVQAKEIRRVVLLLDGHEPFVVETVGSFDRVFSLFTQEIQNVRTAGERTH